MAREELWFLAIFSWVGLALVAKFVCFVPGTIFIGFPSQQNFVNGKTPYNGWVVSQLRGPICQTIQWLAQKCCCTPIVERFFCPRGKQKVLACALEIL